MNATTRADADWEIVVIYAYDALNNDYPYEGEENAYCSAIPLTCKEVAGYLGDTAGMIEAFLSGKKET